MGSTAGDSRRRRIAIPRRPSGTTRAPHIAGLFSIADVGSTQRPRGQRADGSPALRLFRLRSGLNCGKSAVTGRIRPVAVGIKLGGKTCVVMALMDAICGCCVLSGPSTASFSFMVCDSSARFTSSFASSPVCKADPASLCFSCFSCFSCGAACTSLCNTIGDEFERRRASAARESRVSASRWSVCWLPAASCQPSSCFFLSTSRFRA